MDDPIKTNISDDNQTLPPQSLPASPKLKEQAPISVDQKIDDVAKLMQMDQSDKVAKEEKDEYWENYAREIELEKEVVELGGIEKVENGEVPIPPQLAKEMGVKASVGAHSPMETVTGFSVGGIALDDNQLAGGLQKPTSSGFRWLAEWFIFQLLKAHYLVKNVKGKITRSKPS